MIARRRPTGNRSATRRGFSLMEVVLAMAILGVAIAVIGELVRLGSRSAAMARDLSMAQLLCDSKMAEIAAGIAAPEPAVSTPFELEPDWLYSIEVEPTNQEGLLAVRVTVQQDVDPSNQPPTFSVVRWIPDPAFVAPGEATQAGSEETSSGTDQSRTGSQGTNETGPGSN